VGEIDSINAKVLHDLIDDDYIPIIASIGANEDGQSYNINADTVAAEIAASIQADKIIFLTDVEGLYKNLETKQNVISSLSFEESREMIETGRVQGGMLPKVQGCARAVEAGVKRAHILNGTVPHALLLEIFTNEGIGTMISK
ncbi:MAG TPA: acetylglutamate kinase, partial [Actinobacteria bacterium]|nr:acetylglutamate kinase [Actinomycetota bacterium]